MKNNNIPYDAVFLAASPCKLAGLSILALLAGAVSSSNAQLADGETIGIDFNGSAATTGTNFNPFSEDTDDGATANLASLIDLTGVTVTGVTFSL